MKRYPTTLRQTEVGRNNMVIFLHRKNRIRKLTKKELKAIFTGRVTNWKKLGGRPAYRLGLEYFCGCRE